MPGKSDDTYRPQAPTAKAVGGSLRTTRVNPATHSIVKIGRPGSSKTTAPTVKTAAQAKTLPIIVGPKKALLGHGAVAAAGSQSNPTIYKGTTTTGYKVQPAIVRPAPSPIATLPTRAPIGAGGNTSTGIKPGKNTVGSSGVTSKTQYPTSPISNPDQGGGVGGLSPVTNAGGFGFDLGRLLQIGALAAIAILLLIYLRKHRPAPARRVPARNRKG